MSETAAPSLPAPQSLDELRAHLLKTHGAAVAADDPILMVYTIHRVAVDEMAAMLEAAKADQVDALEKASATHREAMEAASAKHREAVEKAVESIASEVMTDTVRERLLAMQEAAVTADRTHTAMRRLVWRLSLLSLMTSLAAILAVMAAVLVLR